MDIKDLNVSDIFSSIETPSELIKNALYLPQENGGMCICQS